MSRRNTASARSNERLGWLLTDDLVMVRCSTTLWFDGLVAGQESRVKSGGVAVHRMQV